MVETRVVFARVPARIHRRVQQIAQEQELSMATIVKVALTELADRYQAGDEIVLVRRTS